MNPPEKTTSRRLTITLRRRLWVGIRPTIVIEGRGQPTQWGTGTWQVPADEPATVGVYLHLRGLTWGRATITVHPTDTATLQYLAPWFPLQRGALLQT